jgi:ribonuclease HI/endonuclease/exonuclease/phosphatase family metal-dependent hydrolase
MTGMSSLRTATEAQESSTDGNLTADQEFQEIVAAQSIATLWDATSPNLSDPLYLGDDMRVKGPSTGLRIVTNNFQRKLYANTANLIETMLFMSDTQTDIIVGTEPGLSNAFNINRLKNTCIQHGFRAVATARANNTSGGGLVFILNRKWAKVPTKLMQYSPDHREAKGRAASLVFHNREQGDHSKLQVIGVHGFNSPEANTEHSTAMLSWVILQKQSFAKLNCLATTIIAADLNAAESTMLDTDRGRREPVQPEWQEKDAFVVKAVKAMNVVDLFRGRFPKTQAVTRVSTTGTNRLRDRIFVTQEAATHPAAAVAILKTQILAAGSDHLPVMADLPIDTAYVARGRELLWQPLEQTKWRLDKDELGHIPEGKDVAMNEALEGGPAQPGHAAVVAWIMEAAQGTMLKAVTKTYPKKVSKKKFYSPADHTAQANMTALRNALNRAALGESDARRIGIQLKRTLRTAQDTPFTPARIASLLKVYKEGDMVAAIDLAEDTIRLTVAHLSKKERRDRTKEVREAVKRRNLRFADPGRRMLKLVINSIMRRYHEDEGITATAVEDGMAYSEGDVSAAVKRFYTDWMATRVPVDARWNSWEAMLDVDLDQLKEDRHTHLVASTYKDSKLKYDKLQEEEGIWDGVRQACTIREFKTALKLMKSGTAPGPSGLSFDLLKALTDEHLGPILDIVNSVLATGNIDQDMNKSLLRPIPKTQDGLADLTNTRPIALMEALMKLTERVMCSRILEVLKGTEALRSEQHGSLPGRSSRSPIRSLTEVIEDALVTGKELHIFSADISKAFDSLEFWSQAIGWSALGMPKDLVNLLVDMDKGGETEVILGQGRTAEGFASGRGVRQGSIAGPLKWVVFMNFWLEYAHKEGAGHGYRMSEAMPGDKEHIGYMFVDDSNWFASDTRGMQVLARAAEEFVEFHGLAFNKAKCEYSVLNQKKNALGEYDLPNWSDGQAIQTKMRRADSQEDKKARRDNSDLLEALEIGALSDDASALISQPTDEELEQIKAIMETWAQEAAKAPDLINHSLKAELAACVAVIKDRLYGAPLQEQNTREHDAKLWLTAVQEAKAREQDLALGDGEDMKYLGVHFELNCLWKKQRAVLAEKFRDRQERISSTKPTQEQAVYCVNAVINAAMKYPLQVANVPVTTLRAWDAANRATIRRSANLSKQTGEALHLPKDRGGLGLMSLEEAVLRQRVTDQIMWLNSDSRTGETVRAARRRMLRKGTKEKGTLQRHTDDACKAAGMNILPELFEWVDFWGAEHRIRNYNGVEAQATADIAHANSSALVGGTAHAFGDGATYADAGRAGWGLYVATKEGAEPERAHTRLDGRVSGAQQNDAAETMAILMALTNVHPRDPVVMYCDNQGCVDTWNKVVMGDTPVTLDAACNRAMWSRVRQLVSYRRDVGTTTKLLWIHSHVDDGDRATDTKSKYTCACRQGHRTECATASSDPAGTRWMHAGNDTADSLAKAGAARMRSPPP